MEDRKNYIDRVLQYSRKDLLQSCRLVGISAYKIKNNEKLATLLWEAKNKLEGRE